MTVRVGSLHEWFLVRQSRLRKNRGLFLFFVGINNSTRISIRWLSTFGKRPTPVVPQHFSRRPWAQGKRKNFNSDAHFFPTEKIEKFVEKKSCGKLPVRARVPSSSWGVPVSWGTPTPQAGLWQGWATPPGRDMEPIGWGTPSPPPERTCNDRTKFF